LIINYVEQVVDRVLPEILENYDDICKCETCLEDMKAYALNNIKPLYFVREKGKLYSRINESLVQFNADVHRAVIQAVERISTNPKHKEG
jgi:competence protein ComFB